MQVGLPIFAVSPKIGTLNDLYLSERIAYFASCVDEEEIVESLKKLYLDFQQHSQSNGLDAYDLFGKETILNIHHKIWKKD